MLLLSDALAHGKDVLTTGLVLQELLQGFSGPQARQSIVDRFRHLPMLVPTREDHVQAAELGNQCRRKGVQVGTIAALIAQLCVHHELTLLTARGASTGGSSAISPACRERLLLGPARGILDQGDSTNEALLGPARGAMISPGGPSVGWVHRRRRR